MVVIGEVVGCDDEMKGWYSKNSVRGIRLVDRVNSLTEQ